MAAAAEDRGSGGRTLVCATPTADSRQQRGLPLRQGQWLQERDSHGRKAASRISEGHGEAHELD